MTTTVGTITELWRYPIKSIGGERITHAELSPLGVDGDRRVALRDLSSGKIVSSKSPKLGTKLLSVTAALDDADGTITVTIGDTAYRSDEPEALNAALSELLARPVQIEVATDAAEVYESYWPAIDGLALSDVTTDLPIAMYTARGTFTDLAALHVITTSTMCHLRRLAPASTITSSRFRPSIVVETSPDYDPDADIRFIENSWVDGTVRVGGATIAMSGTTPRCIMTTLPQPDLPRDPHILQALAEHNRMDFAGFGNFACLGAYAEVTTPGTISIGDPFVFEREPSGT